MENFDLNNKEVIGRGAFALCYVVREKCSGRLVVLKKLTSSVEDVSEEEKAEMLNEVSVLANLNHPNIILYIGSFIHDGSQHIVMEYANGGSLGKLIKEQQKLDEKGTYFREERIMEWIAQIVVAVKYIHEQNILHRDIKTANILLWGEGKRIVKVADFGIAKVLSSNHKMAQTCVGTPYYLSPELCYGKDYDDKSDIWALGCVLFELLTLVKPFQSSNIPSLVLAITTGKREEIPPAAHEHFSPDILKLVNMLLEIDPDMRPDIHKLHDYAFVNKKIVLWEAIQDDIIQLEGSFANHETVEYFNNKNRMTDEEKEEVSIMNISEPVHSPSSGSNLSHLSKRSSGWSSSFFPTSASTLSASSLGSLTARLQMGKELSKKRVFRWGNGQQKPILDEKLFSFNVNTMSTPISMVETNRESDHTLALSEDGILYSWGCGQEGRLGHGIRELKRCPNVRNPKEIKYFSELGIQIIDMSCGDGHSAAIADDGTIWVWGDLGSAGGCSRLKLRRLTPFIDPEEKNLVESLIESKQNKDQTSTSTGTANPIEILDASNSIPSLKSQEDTDHITEFEKGNEDRSGWPSWAKIQEETLTSSFKKDFKNQNPFSNEVMPVQSLLQQDCDYKASMVGKQELNSLYFKNSEKFVEEDTEDNSLWPSWAKEQKLMSQLKNGPDINPFSSPKALEQQQSENPFPNFRDSMQLSPSIRRISATEKDSDLSEKYEQYSQKKRYLSPSIRRISAADSARSIPEECNEVTEKDDPPFFKFERMGRAKQFKTSRLPKTERVNRQKSGLSFFKLASSRMAKSENDIKNQRLNSSSRMAKSENDIQNPSLNSSEEEFKYSNRDIQAYVDNACPPDIPKEKLKLNPINQSKAGVTKSTHDFLTVDMTPASKITIGSRIDLPKRKLVNCGIVRYIGPTDFARGIWIGIELDKPEGKNNGTVEDKEYFTTEKNHGIFVRHNHCKLTVQTETNIEHKDVMQEGHLTKNKSKEIDVEEKSQQNEGINIDDHQITRMSSSQSNFSSNSEVSIVSDDEEVDNYERIIYAPRRVGALRSKTFIKVTCGDRFTVALTREGELFSWGANDYGQLGIGDDEERDEPTSVQWSRNMVVKSIAAGGEFMLAIDGKNAVYAWGRGAEGQLGLGYEVYDEPQCLPEKIKGISVPVLDIAAGGAHCAAVTDQGEVYTWGNGEFGQLGHDNNESILQPQLVQELARSGEDQHIVSVACGAQHTMALTSTRTVYSWGAGDGGRLGHGNKTKSCPIPTIVSALSGQLVNAIGCTNFSSFAIVSGESYNNRQMRMK